MALASKLHDALAEAVAAALERAEAGHCLRVDHLDEQDARALCERLRARLTAAGAGCYVLAGNGAAAEPYIPAERAIELRNRKQQRLCLLVPAGVGDGAASSLTNAFAAFDLGRCWQEVATTLRDGLPAEVQQAVTRVREQLRGPAEVPPEAWADYLAAVAAAPSLATAGLELWRVNLLPDTAAEVAEQGLLDRLTENRRCVAALARPARAQSSLAERFEQLNLTPGPLRDGLRAYLTGRRLRDTAAWLHDLAAVHAGELTFERWEFVNLSTDLRALHVRDLVDKNGEVLPKTGFAQPDGANTPPRAPYGPKAKITLKWEPDPKKPRDVKHWSVALIPSRDEYPEGDASETDLPTVKVAASKLSAGLTLSLEGDEPGVNPVQIRVVGLDPYGAEVRGEDGQVVEGLSQEFWLVKGEDEPVNLGGQGRRATVATLPLARLRAALDVPSDALEASGGTWSVSDLEYFSISFNGRLTARLGLSPVLKRIEEQTLGAPAGAGRYRARVDAAEKLDPGALELVGLPETAGTEAGGAWLRQRDGLFKLLRREAARGLVETASWTTELANATRRYAAAWRALVETAATPRALAEALTVDTVEVTLEQTRGEETSLLLLPTHPLRLLWYSAYAELLWEWEEQLLAQPQKDRARLLELKLVERIAPLNCPLLLPSFDGQQTYLFAHNLAFFWGVALPLESDDAVRRLADLTRVTGLPADEATLTDLTPDRLAEEFEAYRTVHPYLDALRLNLINPGNGVFVAEALRTLGSTGESDDEASEALPPPRLELLAHAPEPLPLALPALDGLQREWYEAQPKGRRHHLAPLCAIALRPLADSGELPGGDFNLAVQVDSLPPRVGLVPPPTAPTDSSSLYGLLVRLVPDFSLSEGEARWVHRLALPEVSRERHPREGRGWYTDELVATHRTHLTAVGRLLNPAAPQPWPGVVAGLTVTQQARLERVHEQADWVVTLDRFLGVEIFNHPSHEALAGLARKYLLDYVPEFLEGLGHRMLVTTAHRDEIGEVLGRAMRELGFEQVEQSIGRVLDHLKTISGRLALRVVGDSSRAREAVALGAVAAWLRAQGRLADAIIIPVDAHPELFCPPARRRRGERGDERAGRCDLILVNFKGRRLEATLIEVKARSRNQPSVGLMEVMADQIDATARGLEGLFFSRRAPAQPGAAAPPPRLDHVLQRSRLATLLRFYLRRARRHGLLTNDQSYHDLEQGIASLESGIPALKLHRRGYIINLAAAPQPPVKRGLVDFEFLTASDFGRVGLAAGYDDGSGVGPGAPAEGLAASVREPVSRSAGGEAPKRDDSAVARDQTPHPPPAHAEVVSGGGPREVRVELGRTVGDQEPVVWSASVKGSPHLFILGLPGQGKSVTATHLVCEMARQGLPALILDFHGQFAQPAGAYARVAQPTVLTVGEGLPFSPFEAEANDGPRGDGWKTNCYRIAEIFGYVCKLGDIQRDLVFQALDACYRERGFAAGQPDRLPTINEVTHQIAALEETTATRNVLARCRALLEFGLFRETTATEPVDLLALIGGGLVVDVSAVDLEEVQLAAGAFLLRKIYRDMFRWGETDRLRFAIILDEAHRLARDTTLPKIMKEGRKFGIAVLAASQNLNDFHDEVLSNAGTKVIFCTNYPESKRAAGFLRSRQPATLTQALESLGNGQAYVQTPERPQAAWVAMHKSDLAD